MTRTEQAIKYLLDIKTSLEKLKATTFDNDFFIVRIEFIEDTMFTELHSVLAKYGKEVDELKEIWGA